MTLIPATSRLGATITAALYLGFTHEAAARYSCLTSIPIFILAGSYLGLKLVMSDVPVAIDMLLVPHCRDKHVWVMRMGSLVPYFHVYLIQ